MPATVALPKAKTHTSTKWEACSCPGCGSKAHRPFHTLTPPVVDGTRILLAQCPECKLVFLNPRPSEAIMGNYYPEHYVCNQFHPRGGDRPTFRDAVFNALFVRGRDRMRITQLRRLLPTMDANTRVLDFGCGAGSFLKALHQRFGCHACGVENASTAFELLKQNQGVHAFNSLDDCSAHENSEPFDFITLCHVLEHLYDPKKTLEQLRAASHAKTRIIIEIPNIASWPAERFGEHWLGWDAPRHLSYFSPDAIKNLLARAGWRMESLHFPPQSIGLVYSFANKSGWRWLDDMHAHTFKICATIGLATPFGHAMSLARRNDFMVAVAVPAE